jgi:hypothetical protein
MISNKNLHLTNDRYIIDLKKGSSTLVYSCINAGGTMVRVFNLSNVIEILYERNMLVINGKTMSCSMEDFADLLEALE